MISSLRRNTLWNLAGLTAPMVVAAGVIPSLIAGLGVERFGILTLAWTLIGYLSLFDLGLGRALTKMVADGSASRRAILTALRMLAGLGLAGGVLLAGATQWLVRWLRIPAALSAEAATGFLVVAAAIPLVTLTAGLRGVLEARQRFAALSALRAAMGVLTFAGPLAAMRIQAGLPAMLGALALSRLIALAAHAALLRKDWPDRPAPFDRAAALRLLRYGGWITVSNVVSPLMVSLDRFLISALLSAGVVAYYTTPFEMITRLQVVPAAVAGVLFPSLAEALVHDPARARLLYRRGLLAILLALAPAAAAAIAFAPAALEWWLGAAFAARSAPAARILAAGVLVNALASAPSAWLQASGRPDLTARLHLGELPLYLAGAVLLIRSHGIEGAALAWTLRVSLDAAALFWLARQRKEVDIAACWTTPYDCRNSSTVSR